MPRLTQILLGRSNYYKRYVERITTQKNTIKHLWSPIGGWQIDRNKKSKIHYDRHRPWETAFETIHETKRVDQGPFYPIKEWDVFKGDVVELLVGKDKGKRGLIKTIIKERNWVFIKGLNCKHEMDDTVKNITPMCFKIEQPLLATQVKLVDPKDGQGTDIEWRFSEEGERVRVSIKTGSIIPLPSGYEMGDDQIVPAEYPANDKDTTEEDLLKVTFKPKVVTFEEEVMKEMGIVEERKPATTYWY